MQVITNTCQLTSVTRARNKYDKVHIFLRDECYPLALAMWPKGEPLRYWRGIHSQLNIIICRINWILSQSGPCARDKWTQDWREKRESDPCRNAWFPNQARGSVAKPAPLLKKAHQDGFMDHTFISCFNLTLVFPFTVTFINSYPSHSFPSGTFPDHNCQ